MTIEETVLPSGMRFWVARPADASPRPAVFLHHERYGPVKHSFYAIEKMAEEGYVGCLPDLYHRFPDDRGLLERSEARCDPTDEETIADLDEAIGYLGTLDFVDSANIGMAGFCASGRFPLVFAASRPGLMKGIAIFHGGVYPRDYDPIYPGQQTVANVIPKISCPLFGAFGEADFLVPLANVLRLRWELELHRKSYQFKVFPNTPHAWGDTEDARYHPKEAEEAWRMMISFFSEMFEGRWDNNRARWIFESDVAVDYDYAKLVRER